MPYNGEELLAERKERCIHQADMASREMWAAIAAKKPQYEINRLSRAHDAAETLALDAIGRYLDWNLSYNK